MDKKIYVTKDGYEVKVGQPFACTMVGNGFTYTINTSSLSESTLKMFIDEGLVTEKPERDYKFYFDWLCDKWGIDDDLLKHIIKETPVIVFSAMLKKVAIDLDKKYTNHISENTYVNAVSLKTGAVIDIICTNKRDFERFAAFRTIGDANKAIAILKPLYDKIYG